MDGGGFGGPPWSVRVSLANFDDEGYEKIGAYMREIAEEYHGGVARRQDRQSLQGDSAAKLERRESGQSPKSEEARQGRKAENSCEGKEHGKRKEDGEGEEPAKPVKLGRRLC